MPRQASGSCRARFPNASGRRGGTVGLCARRGGGGEGLGLAGGGERRHRLRLRRPRDRRLLCVPFACCCFFQGLCLSLREKTRFCVSLNSRDGGENNVRALVVPGTPLRPGLWLFCLSRLREQRGGRGSLCVGTNAAETVQDLPDLH